MPAAFAAALAVVLAVSVGAVPNPRTNGGWVTDLADVLSDGEEAAMNSVIAELHTDLGVEIAVVTVPDVAGTPKAFATELFNTWGVGDGDANNGLLVLLVMGERRLEMETGYGLEATLPDGWLGTMQQQAMVPHFKQGEFGAGLIAGLADINARLRRSPEEAAAGAVAPPPFRPPAARSKTIVGFPVWLMLLALLFPPIGIWVGWQIVQTGRWKRCPECGLDREKLDEDVDDEHLEAGQQTEEEIGSVNYDVWACLDCGSVGVRRRNKRFSGYSTCLGCDFKTVRKTSRTLTAATQHSTGVARITLSCSHCDFGETYTRSIPRLPSPSSSSSSSSSWSSSSGSSFSSGGFGGGSSGGGGAGSSW